LVLILIFVGVGEDFHEKTKLTPLSALKQIVRFEKSPSLFKEYPDKPKIKLPEPDFKGMPLEEAIRKRRSIRNYSPEPVSLKELSILLFSAQGITGYYAGIPLRTAPSAGALYPIEIYIYAHNVEGLERGIYHYNVREHAIEFIKKGDYKNQFFNAGLFQEMFLEAPLVFIYSAIFKRTTYKYDDRGYRYVYIEAGHIAQNVSLQAVSLGLVSCVIGAFFDDMVNKIIGVDGKEEAVIYLQTIGKPK